MVIKHQSQDLKSSDLPAHDGVGPSGVIGGVTQRSVSFWLAQVTLVGCSDVVCDGPSSVIGGVTLRGLSLWLTQVVLTGCSGVSTWHVLDLPTYAIELSNYLGASGDILRMFRR